MSQKLLKYFEKAMDFAHNAPDPSDEDFAKSFATSDLSGAGVMAAEQASSFLRKVIEQSRLLQQIHVDPMRAPTKEINRIGFGSAILKKGTEGTAISSGEESKPTATKITLDAKEVYASVPVTWDLLEDTLEGLDFNGQAPWETQMLDTILDLISEQAALDLEKLVLQGDTTGSGYLSTFDGAFKLASASYDHGLDSIDSDLFRDMILTLPPQYQQRKSVLRFVVGPRTELLLRSHYGKRGTALGDVMISDGDPESNLSALGIKIIETGGIPEDGGASGKEAKILLGNPRQMTLGVWRKMRIDWDKDLTARGLRIVLSMKADFKHADPDGVVGGSSILTAV